MADLSPFREGRQMELGYINDLFIFRLIDQPGRSSFHARVFSEEERAELLSELKQIDTSDQLQLISALGEMWYASNRFTYVGLAPHAKALPSDFDQNSEISKQLLLWIDTSLKPYLTESTQKRVTHGTPKSVIFDKILPALWVLESEETSTQGTGFMLEGVGLVTCEHIFKADICAFRADNFSKKYPISLIKKNSAIDLAVLQIEMENTEILYLKAETDVKVQQLDELTVIGYPNYRYGDTGTIVPGIVSGFRTVSTITRILTNAPIIAGNSGGPVLNSQGRVIGVAVTGAERMTEAQETEDHGVIPIDALQSF
ncbi:S1 family peptidase [Laspinema olomoucense]|uniref:S1 family peptidase n=1 Tax=Laspinema olomoucense TaxID=3231600 RepID=UPI0021BA4431|nr:serine protease [Laspinema sp. D3d]MCT7973408.1 serine protease [Laspinema sp. D3d]